MSGKASAPRILTGSWRGRRLEVPLGKSVRPTSERMREALFNIIGPEVQNSVFLDLFAGSGAIGLEALSRGASFAMFVENDREALRCLQNNIAKLDAGGRCRVLKQDATRLPATGMAADLVFLDPPYDQDLVGATLDALMTTDLLTSKTTIVAECVAKSRPLLPAPFEITDERRYGVGKLLFIARHGSPD